MAQRASEPEMMIALSSASPLEELKNVTRALLSKGVSRQDVIERLEDLRSGLRDAGREREEDVVLDVLDFVSGWASPHMKI
jgi:hypothetical protein